MTRARGDLIELVTILALPSKITCMRSGLTTMETAKRATLTSAKARNEKFSFAVVLRGVD